MPTPLSPTSRVKMLSSGFKLRCIIIFPFLDPTKAYFKALEMISFNRRPRGMSVSIANLVLWILISKKMSQLIE
jgi:hypothetical protein